MYKSAEIKTAAYGKTLTTCFYEYSYTMLPRVYIDLLLSFDNTFMIKGW